MSVFTFAHNCVRTTYTGCSFEAFKPKYRENNTFSGKILNTTVSQFQEETHLSYLFLSDGRFLGCSKIYFLFPNGNLYFAPQILTLPE